MSLGRAAQATGLDKSAVQRAADTLAELGYLERDAQGQLRPSTRCLDLAFNFLKSHPVVQHAYPVLLRLGQECGERANLSLFERTNLIYAIRILGSDDFDLHSALIGRRMPVYSTAGGRAMLACLHDGEVRQILKECQLRRRTSRTKTSISEIETEVAKARALGYAIVTGESITREVAIAAAVVDSRGQPLAAVHVASNSPSCSADDYARRHSALVVAAAGRISEGLFGVMTADRSWSRLAR